MAFGPHAFSAVELSRQLALERHGAPFMVYRDAAAELRIQELDGVDRVTVGRSERCHIALEWDPEVSRAHAQLERIGADWTVIDEGVSRNGSFVNGERVRGRRRLVDGDVLRFGGSSILFRAPGPPLLPTAPTQDRPVEVTPAQRRVLVALCRPFAQPGAVPMPATNIEIAAELSLSVDGVKTHIKALFGRLGIDDLPQNRKRAELARRAIESGLVAWREIAP
jgi:pSer/pThr/pTyr-binding forkhead associated (FHA) protein